MLEDVLKVSEMYLFTLCTKPPNEKTTPLYAGRRVAICRIMSLLCCVVGGDRQDAAKSSIHGFFSRSCTQAWCGVVLDYFVVLYVRLAAAGQTDKSAY